MFRRRLAGRFKVIGDEMRRYLYAGGGRADP
jgi:hypothetical protein